MDQYQVSSGQLYSQCEAVWQLYQQTVSYTQVPLGSVTPLAVVQETASAVTLLLDQKLKGQDRLLVHPLTNSSTVAISSEGLERFLM